MSVGAELNPDEFATKLPELNHVVGPAVAKVLKNVLDAAMCSYDKGSAQYACTPKTDAAAELKTRTTEKIKELNEVNAACPSVEGEEEGSAADGACMPPTCRPHRPLSLLHPFQKDLRKCC